MNRMSVLTREEARTRARLLTVRRYAVDLDLTRGEEVFGSRTVVHFTVREPGDTFLELRPHTLHRAVLDGRPLDPTHHADGRLPLHGLTVGEHELCVEADMPYSRTGEGMHRFTDPADGETYLYTQCCLADAPLVYAAFDQPDLKAVFDVTVTAPPEWTVWGNGVAERVGDPAEGRWRMATTPPISTYLLAVAAGPWHSVRAEHAGLPFGLHARRSLASQLDADAEELLDLTRRCFDRYHQVFAEPYPFDSYDQVFVPEFNFGAMENPGLVTLKDEYVFRSAVTDEQRRTRAVTVAHEMAHMWFGNLVTLRWWDDIWLNESFAEYMGYQIVAEATPFRGAWTGFAARREAWGYDADQRPSTHPVAPPPDGAPDTARAWLHFDGISYAKGAAALRQLVAWLGPETFLAGVNEHFARHRFGNATLADLLDSLGHVSGRDVHAWAARWLRTTGVDTLLTALEPAGEPASAADTDGDATTGWRVRVRRHGVDGSRPHRLSVGVYDTVDEPDAAGGLALRERRLVDVPSVAEGEDGEEDAASFVLPGPKPALVLPNDEDLSYTKVRLDADSWETARRSLSRLPDPLSRAVLWNAARDLVRDGELEPTAYLEVVRDQLPAERDTAVVEAVLGFARTAVADRYLPSERRHAALQTLTAVGTELLAAADAGADLRLVAVRTLLGCATTDGTVRDWWAAGTVPGGPELDAELRWLLLYRLAVLGACDHAEIDAEAARDTSAFGRLSAARCRAALPDAQAKATAWAELFTPEPGAELSQHLFTATAQGFWQPEQRRLVEEYVPHYFRQAPGLAERRGHAVAVAVGRYAFPHTVVTGDVLRRGEECLRTADPVPPLRRQLRDQLDDLRRALRVRRTPTG